MINNKISKLKNIIQLYTNTENMTNNKQQTAVEWLIKQFETTEFYSEESKENVKEQAKEMHKKEMVMFVLNVMGKYRNGDVLAEVATELYEQTYEGSEQ
jgi:hypothetical protein